MRTQLRVNWTTCVGHGICAELLPEIIQLDDWGFPIVHPGPIPADLEPHAKRAVELCPTLALLREKMPHR